MHPICHSTLHLELPARSLLSSASQSDKNSAAESVASQRQPYLPSRSHTVQTKPVPSSGVQRICLFLSMASTYTWDCVLVGRWGCVDKFLSQFRVGVVAVIAKKPVFLPTPSQRSSPTRWWSRNKYFARIDNVSLAWWLATDIKPDAANIFIDFSELCHRIKEGASIGLEMK